MKNQTGIWIDGSKAVIVTLTDGKEHIGKVEAEVENSVHHFGDGDLGSHMGGRHLVPEKKFDERKKHQIDQYLGQVLAHVKDVDELYVFGPAETKTILQHKLNSEQTYKRLAGKLLAVETADSMTQNQVVAQVRKYFGRGR